jgi:hypothetical protein
MQESENNDGVFRLMFPKDRAVPDDGVVKISVLETASIVQC